jgi:hypothetical protein
LILMGRVCHRERKSEWSKRKKHTNIPAPRDTATISVGVLAIPSDNRRSTRAKIVPRKVQRSACTQGLASCRFNTTLMGAVFLATAVHRLSKLDVGLCPTYVDSGHFSRVELTVIGQDAIQNDDDSDSFPAVIRTGP